MNFFEKTISSERIYDGKIINLRKDLVELENGNNASREIVEHSGGVGILAVDSDGQILMVRQYRCGVGRMSLEIPAGKLNLGENPEECGRRELEEETGFIPGYFEAMGFIDPSPAYLSEKIYIYLAGDLISAKQSLDPDEFLSVEKLSIDRAVEMCMTGEITDAKTLVAVLKYKNMKP